MDDSLEALLEKATNPKNKYEDWEFIMAFCDKVNADLQGPQVTLRIIVPKIRHENEKVAMLSLTLLEACVKNCGQRFHQELGKFKFLNELIRMISPKYLGDSTASTIKNKIKELLYSWKVGLPSETKINDAYMMLKREGLIFDESVGPDRTLEPEQTKPKVTLVEDPKQSQMLQKLLSSRNPDDLRAANRLIREMVRRDEKRMQKLQKRLEEVELIQNNVKLLNELLIHMKEDAGEEEKSLMEELYKSIEKMRPNLFRMASELKQNEEGMSEILRTNDSVLRVMDLYKSKLGDPSKASSDNGTVEKAPQISNGAAKESSNVSSTKADSGDQLPSSSEATALVENGATGGGGADDILIDLADLNFGSSPAATGDSGASGGGGSSTTDLNSSLGLGSLMDDLTALDLSTPTSANLGTFSLPSSSVGGAQPLLPGSTQSSLSPSQLHQLQHQQPQWTGFPQTIGTAPVISSTSSSIGSTSVSFPPSSSTTSSKPSSQLPPSNTTSPFTIPPPPQQQQTQNPGMGMGFGNSSPVFGNDLLGLRSQPLQATPSASSTQQTQPFKTTPMVGVVQQPLLDPLAVLDNTFVPLDSIKPGSLPAMSVMSKDNVSITFHFAENAPAPGVSVIVISIISTSPAPISNFQFQAAVPKVMRVKLQPPTTMELGAYNPILPPPSISQVLLLVNPSKAKIRMKYRISYNQGSSEVVEMGEASDFPSSL